MTNELTTVTDFPGTWSLVGWEPPPGLLFETWHDIGQQLGALHRAMRWVIGDWLNYGEHAYGEKYAQGIGDDLFGYQDLRNIASVAARIPRNIRVTSLSWSHHREVAPLPHADQRRLLARAAEKGWTCGELRQAVREARALPFSDNGAQPPGPEPPAAEAPPELVEGLAQARQEVAALRRVVVQAAEVVIEKAYAEGAFDALVDAAQRCADNDNPAAVAGGDQAQVRVTCPQCGYEWSGQ